MSCPGEQTGSMNETSKAYFAAFFETCGTIYNDMSENRKYLSVSIVPNKKFNTALRAGKELWGGELLNDATNSENLEIDPRADHCQRQKEMEWKISADEAEKFLFDIAPYLLISRDKSIQSIREIARFWEKELFRCLYCNKIFDDKNEFYQHKDVHKIRV